MGRGYEARALLSESAAPRQSSTEEGPRISRRPAVDVSPRPRGGGGGSGGDRPMEEEEEGGAGGGPSLARLYKDSCGLHGCKRNSALTRLVPPFRPLAVHPPPPKEAQRSRLPCSPDRPPFLQSPCHRGPPLPLPHGAIGHFWPPHWGHPPPPSSFPQLASAETPATIREIDLSDNVIGVRPLTLSPPPMVRR